MNSKTEHPSLNTEARKSANAQQSWVFFILFLFNDALNVCKALTEKDSICMWQYVSVKPLSIDGSFPDVQAAKSKGSNEPQYHQKDQS